MSEETEAPIIEEAVREALEAMQEPFPYDCLAKELFACAAVLALIIKETVVEVDGMSIEEIARRIQHPASIVKVGEHCLDNRPAQLEKNESGRIRMDCVVTLRIRDDVFVRVNVEAQNKANPGYPLGTRAVFYGAQLIVEQMNQGWLSGSDYSGLRKVYSIWLVAHAPRKMQGRIFRSTMSTSEIVPDGSEKLLSAPDPAVDKLCVVVAYLPDSECKTACADWLSTMAIALGERSTMEERKQALAKNGIVLEPSVEEKVRKMCTLTEGLIENVWAKAQAEAQVRINAAEAYASAAQEEATVAKEEASVAKEEANAAKKEAKTYAVSMRAAVHLLRSLGLSLPDISEKLDLPLDKVQMLSKVYVGNEGATTLH